MAVSTMIIGAGGRGDAYSQFALDYPHELEVVAVAEPDELRRHRLVTRHDIAPDMIFDSWESALASGKKLADTMINCTQDRQHFASTMQMLEHGYDVLLEKPMSPVLHENIQLIQKAEDEGSHLQICHVLRYSPFWQKMLEIVESNVLGRIVSLTHRENLIFWHMAHSFVRGNWRKEATSGPMILSKCCHDFDILLWLLKQEVVCLMIALPPRANP